MRLLPIALFATLLAARVAAQQPAVAPASARPTVIASGTSEVSVSPDRVDVTFTVVTRGTSAAEAGRTNIARMTPLLAALRRLQIPDSLLETTGYSVSREDRDWGAAGMRTREEADVRYVARNAVRVTLKDLDRLGVVVDSALANGASEAEQIQWKSSRMEALQLEALGLAVRAARQQAEVMARAAGGALGELMEVTEGAMLENRLGYTVARLSAVQVTNTSISPRRLSIPAGATVRFAFVPAGRD